MQITNGFIADQIGVHPGRLYKKCNIYNGTHCIWLTREILLNDWDRIGIDGRLYLIELLKMLMFCGNGRGGPLLDELIINDMSVLFKIPYIQALGKVYAKNSPFITQKRGIK